jgi:hypothetical protein
MATSEILGLFTTPEQYQLAQQQAQEAQAIQYANLTPMARANYGTFRAGQQLAGTIGRALGGQDPQLKMISMRQQLASQLDPSKPESFMQAAELAAKSGDQQFAIALANAGREANIKVAQASKERQLAVPARIQESQQAAVISQAIRQYKALPQTPETTQAIETLQVQLDFLSPKPKAEKVADALQIASRVAEIETQLSPDAGVVLPPQVRAGLEAELNNLKKQEKEKNISFGTEAERKSKAKYGKPYADLTPTEAGIVDKLVEESERAKARETKPEFNMGSTKAVEPKDWLKFSEFINKDPLMSRTSSILSDAPSAIETIKKSTQNNFSSASLPAAIAKLTGEGKNMSNQDIERYTRTGGLDQRIAGDVVGFFTGKKTDVTKAQAEQFAVALYRGALLERKQFIQDQAESTGYNESPNYKKTIEQLDKKLSQFKLVTPKGSQSPSAQQSPVVDADKEKRYQEFKAKELAKQSGATR